MEHLHLKRFSFWAQNLFFLIQRGKNRVYSIESGILHKSHLLSTRLLILPNRVDYGWVLYPSLAQFFTWNLVPSKASYQNRGPMTNFNVDCQAHNLKVLSSNLSPATLRHPRGCLFPSKTPCTGLEPRIWRLLVRFRSVQLRVPE